MIREKLKTSRKLRIANRKLETPGRINAVVIKFGTLIPYAILNILL